eukprot:15364486-Ditylum_brightwellii.AAC.2
MRLYSKTVKRAVPDAERMTKQSEDGGIYEITFNSDGKFSNTQLAALYDLPYTDNLTIWRLMNVLKCPLSEKEIEFDPACSKDSYLNLDYEEVK